MELTLYVEARDEDTCGRNCAFLEGIDRLCLLFNVELEETILPAGHVWQDKDSPTMQRCHRCFIATNI